MAFYLFMFPISGSFGYFERIKGIYYLISLVRRNLKPAFSFIDERCVKIYSKNSLMSYLSLYGGTLVIMIATAWW